MKRFFKCAIFILCNYGFCQESRIYTTNEIDTFPWFKKIDCFEEGSPQCFKKQLENHIVLNFNYPRKALQQNITGRVYLRFTIDSIGRVSDIQARSKYKPFEEEGIRIVNEIPTLNPAKIEGKNVSIYYNIPITFNQGKNAFASPIAKNIEIDASSSKEERSIISFDKAHSPPIYLKCEKNNNKSKCFKERLTDDLIDFIIKKISNKNIKEVFAKIYFEIDQDLSLNNIIVVTKENSVKNSIELFLKNHLSIVQPAKETTGGAIPCFFTTDIGLRSKERTVRQ